MGPSAADDGGAVYMSQEELEMVAARRDNLDPPNKGSANAYKAGGFVDALLREREGSDERVSTQPWLVGSRKDAVTLRGNPSMNRSRLMKLQSANADLNDYLQVFADKQIGAGGGTRGSRRARTAPERGLGGGATDGNEVWEQGPAAT